MYLSKNTIRVRWSILLCNINILLFSKKVTKEQSKRGKNLRMDQNKETLSMKERAKEYSPFGTLAVVKGHVFAGPVNSLRPPQFEKRLYRTQHNILLQS